MTDSPKIHATSTGVINMDYKQGNLMYLLLLCKRFGYHLLLSEVRFTGSVDHGYNYTMVPFSYMGLTVLWSTVGSFELKTY